MTMSAMRRATYARIVRLFISLLVLAAACDGTSEPSGVEGRYSVQTVNGQQPPAAVTSVSGGQLQVVDATLELDAPNATIELETRVMGTNGTAGAATSTTYSGTYQVSGDVITFSTLSSSAGQGVGVQAQGVVVSSREVAVTMNFAFAASQGFFTYPVSLILRR